MALITVPDVQPMFEAYLAQNRTWGSLHIVLDDGNVEDEHVWFCIQYAKQRGDQDGARLGKILMAMSKTQRRKLAKLEVA